MIKYGESLIDQIYYGQQMINKVYYGKSLIFSNEDDDGEYWIKGTTVEPNQSVIYTYKQYSQYTITSDDNNKFVVEEPLPVYENMTAMFADNKSLLTLDLSNMDVSIVKNAFRMFYNCSNLTTLNLKNWNTENFESTPEIFSGCSNLTKVSNIRITNKCTNLSYMFSDCNSLTEIQGINSWDTSNVSDMRNLFKNCYKIKELDLSNFDTTNVTRSFSTFFSGCNSLQKLILGPKFKFNSAVTDISYMFMGCGALKELDLRYFNTSNITNATSLFKDCINLEKLYLDNFNLENVVGTSMRWIFSGCSSLNYIRCKQAFRDWCWKNRDSIQVDLPQAMWEGGDGVWDIIDKPGLISGTNLGKNDIILTINGEEITVPTINNKFEYQIDLNKDINSLEGLFGFKSTGSDLHFTELNVNNIPTDKVTTIRGAFYRSIRYLDTLDLSAWNTSKVENMEMLFADNGNLKRLILDNFDCYNVTAMNDMFDYTPDLNYIRCKQAFKDWCIENAPAIKLEISNITWDIVE